MKEQTSQELLIELVETLQKRINDAFEESKDINNIRLFQVSALKQQDGGFALAFYGFSSLADLVGMTDDKKEKLSKPILDLTYEVFKNFAAVSESKETH